MLQDIKNTILEQQKVHQAAVKKSGNTFTARGMGLNIFVTCFVLGGVSIVIPNFMSKLYYGRGKIE